MRAAAGSPGTKLGDELLHELGVLFLEHEERALEHGAAQARGDLGVLGGNGGKFAHHGVVLVVDLDALSEPGLVERGAGGLLQVGYNALVALDGEGLAEIVLAVLGIGHGDEGDILHGVFPVLADNLQAVAQAGDDDGGAAVVHAVHAQLDKALHYGADEGREVFLRALELYVAAPGAHGDEAHGVDYLLGGVYRGGKYNLPALCEVLVLLSGGIGRYSLEFIEDSVKHSEQPPC